MRLLALIFLLASPAWALVEPYAARYAGMSLTSTWPSPLPSPKKRWNEAACAANGSPAGASPGPPGPPPWMAASLNCNV